MGFDYKVGVKLAMTSNMPAMLTEVASRLTGVNLKVGQLTGKFNKLTAAVAGVGAVWAGDKIIRGMAAMARYGDKIVEQQAQLRTLGLNAQKVSAATAYATQVANQVPTTTIAGNLKHLGELRYAGGSMSVAKAILPMVSQANAILRSKLGNIDTDQVWATVKSLEMKGVLNPQTLPRFQKYLGEMVQAVVASNGMVTPRDFLRTFVYGRTAMLGWDSTFMPYLTRAMQSLGTSGAGGGGRSGPGNALMSAFSAVVQGQMPKKAAQMFAALGLGSMQGIAGSSQALTSIHGVKLFERNPYQWVQQVLMPALAAHHITMPNGMNPDHLKQLFGSKAGLVEAQQRDDIIGVISKLFRNRTASQIISEFALFGSYAQGNASMYEKDKRLQKDVLGLGAYQQLMTLSPGMRQMILGAQYSNMMEAMGKALVPVQMAVLTGLTRVFNAIANLSMNHPEVVKAIAVGITALGAALMGAGMIALLAAIGTGGWLIGGLAGLAGALALFGGGMSLRTLATGIHAVATALSVGVLAAALDAGGWMAVGIAAVAGALDLIPWKAVLTGLASGLSKLGHVLGSLWDKVKGWFSGWSHASYMGPIGGAPALIPASYVGGAFYNNGAYTKGASASARGLPGSLGPLGHSYGVPGGVIAGPTPKIVGSIGLGLSHALMKRYGLTAAQASGIVGNLMEESGNFKHLQEAHPLAGIGGYGWAQWTGPRRRQFFAWAAGHHLDPASRAANSGFLFHELDTNYSRAIAAVRAAHTVQDATRAFEHIYEGAGIPHMGVRIHDAESNYDALPSPAIAARGGDRHVTIHNQIKLDGRTVAQNTAKHFAREGNKPPRSARLPDPFAHTPSLPVI